MAWTTWFMHPNQMNPSAMWSVADQCATCVWYAGWPELQLKMAKRALAD